ncbi:Hypothetical predicted protein [Paramuricea clavata]|uniref:Uncharacterized protein n=1 Tax=Paramuricea clavata TaxID=317549 RepID=A0A6S7KS29_PARCT|nr:Hypothetical predicted protein [Paramuricea clavata]
MKRINPFFEKLPYLEKTAFGLAILFDPRRYIKEIVFTEDCGIPCMGLDEGEKIVLDYLIKGRSYATTGIWDLFDYDYHSLPYKIFNQSDQDEICYDIGDDMELVFTFLPIKKKNANLVWSEELRERKMPYRSLKVWTISMFKPDDERASNTIGTLRKDIRSSLVLDTLSRMLL